MLNLIEIIHKRKDCDLVAFKNSQREVTYRQLWDSSVIASGLVPQKGVITAIVMENSPEFAIALFGVLMSGGTALLIHPDIKEDSLRSMLEKTHAACVFTKSTFRDTVQAACGNDTRCIFIDEWDIYSIPADRDKGFNPDADDDTAVIIPTSGTTSDRKFVQLTHKNIFSNVLTVYSFYHLKEGERDLLSLPMTSVFCLMASLLMGLYAGLYIVLYEGEFSAKKFLKILQDDKIEYFFTVPTVLKALCLLKDRPYFNVDRIRRITIGGEKASTGELEEFYETFKGVVIIFGYGMTECSPVISTKVFEDFKERPQSVGRAIADVNIRILDENDNDLPSGEMGEITVSGPNVMKGYLGMDTPNLKDGWFRTGDIGYLDDDGYLYITGRKKNLIISSGRNIYPEEVESVMLNSGLVQECRVRGISSDTSGETVVADVVLKGDADTEQIRKYCLENLPAYKVPRQYIVVDEIEKNSNNKIVRNH